MFSFCSKVRLKLRLSCLCPVLFLGLSVLDSRFVCPLTESAILAMKVIFLVLFLCYGVNAMLGLDVR